MSKDTVKLFQQARAALQSEKTSLSKTLADAKVTAADAEKRLAEIEAALGGAGAAPVKRRGRPATKRKTVKKAAKPVAKKASKKAAKKAPTKKAKNKVSLKQVALEVTKGKALDAKQILEEAKKAGHKFSGKNPLNSLRVMLYTNKKAFQNNKGKFTAA